MSFCTTEFAVFLVCTLALLRAAPRRFARELLLAASAVFYGWSDWRLLGLIGITIASAHFSALAIGRSDAPRPRRLALIGAVALNLGILGLFKYYDFFATSVGAALLALGAHVEVRTLHLVLPVGISFYTFISIGYVADVYRNKVPAERSLADTALFVAFFPHLMAGPIARARDLLPQLKGERDLSWPDLANGAYLIAAGVFKKIFIADNLAAFVQKVFDQPYPDLNGTMVLLALYAFTFQIYCDFSGYTDIARGAAKCMGIDLAVNFDLPYLATSPRDFWRRWHITLSQWLRDYLYIPLGGSRGGRWRTARNLLATMLLGGLWHGAAWTFVVWGGFHGLLLALERIAEGLFPGRAKGPGAARGLLGTAWRVALMFHVTCLGWLFFRANSVGQAWSFIALLFTDQGAAPLVGAYAHYVLFYTWPLLLVQAWQALRRKERVILDLPLPVRTAAFAAALILFAAAGAADSKEFFYFQF